MIGRREEENAAGRREGRRVREERGKDSRYC